MIPIRDINPTSRFPLVTVLLIVVNSAVFLYQTVIGSPGAEELILGYALVPVRLFSGAADGSAVPAAVTLVTSQFLHGGLLHVGGNMLYLWIFGNNVEDAMGRSRFVLFYVLCGIAAALSHAVRHAASPVPMIGASGAVSGVLGAYLLLYPRARVQTLIVFGLSVRAVPIPAMTVLLFWFVLQFVNVSMAEGEGGVAWLAHIGGFAAGMLLIGLFKRHEVPFWGGRSTRSA